MKQLKLSYLFFILILSLFTACSSKRAEPTTVGMQPSVYNIMGITDPKKEIVHFVVNDRPHHIETAPVIHNYTQPSPRIQVSPDIEFISYVRNRPQRDFIDKRLTMRRINTIERRAKSFLGTPYVWGATGPSTFDCSGFTQWVYRDAGINIPRVSREQAKVGEFVRYENLQRGDMVFFDTKKHRSGNVCHVGIYLGNGNFIHASSAGKKVVIFNFNEKPFYKKRFLWGRRVINDGLHYASN